MSRIAALPVARRRGPCRRAARARRGRTRLHAHRGRRRDHAPLADDDVRLPDPLQHDPAPRHDDRGARGPEDRPGDHRPAHQGLPVPLLAPGAAPGRRRLLGPVRPTSPTPTAWTSSTARTSRVAQLEEATPPVGNAPLVEVGYAPRPQRVGRQGQVARALAARVVLRRRQPDRGRDVRPDLRQDPPLRPEVLQPPRGAGEGRRRASRSGTRSSSTRSPTRSC